MMVVKSIQEKFQLGPWEMVKWELDLIKGDLIKGIVEEQDGDWLKIYLLNQDNYVRLKNHTLFGGVGGAGIGAFQFNHNIDTTDTYYLVIGHNDWWSRPEIININVNVYRENIPVAIE